MTDAPAPHGLSLEVPAHSFAYLLLTEGQGTLVHEGRRYPLAPADCYLLPAGTGHCSLEGDLVALFTTLPRARGE